MSTKEEDFKERFVAVMQNLRKGGTKDPEAMWLIGSLAARLMDRARTASWSDFKAGLGGRAYASLLADFEKQGNSFHREGKAKHSYAVQVLAISLIARTQKDPEVQAGNGLLDDMIDFTVSVYRKNKHVATKAN